MMDDFERCLAIARLAVAEPTRSPEYIFRPGSNDAAVMGREFLRLAEENDRLKAELERNARNFETMLGKG